MDTMIIPLNQSGRIGQVGSKARNLLRLQELGTRIPYTYCIPWNVHEAFQQNPDMIRGLLKRQIQQSVQSEKAYAVRSSANTEDALESSFAGQFKSFLYVRGAEDIIDCVETVWDSVNQDSIREYLAHHSMDPGTVKMGVIIQEMVPPRVSGVAFSRNPLTGLRETVVEAVEGPGTALMESGITPMRWVYHHKDFIVQEEEAPIPLETIRQVVEHTRQIAQKAAQPVDLEWVWDGETVSWVQMRPITAMDKARLYSNRISKEMLSGQIKPLVWDVNIPLVNGAWIDILTRIIGPNSLTPHDLAKSFNYRAYYNMGLLGEVFEKVGFSPDALEIMWGVAPKGKEKVSFRPDRQAMKLLPSMLSFLHNAWRISGPFPGTMDRLEKTFRRTLDTIPTLDTPDKVLATLKEHSHTMKEAAHFNIVVPLSAVVYGYIFRRHMEKAGLDYARMDMSPPDRSYDPQGLIRALHREWQAAPPDTKKDFEEGSLEQIAVCPAMDSLMMGFNELIHTFGHLSDNGNDFSVAPWREDPERIRQMIMDHADNPVEFERSTSLDERDLSGARHLTTRFWYRRARRFAAYREKVSFVYTLGFGLFRPLYLSLGRMLAERGILSCPDDIFYLTHSEIEALAMEKQDAGDVQERIRAIRTEMEPPGTWC